MIAIELTGLGLLLHRRKTRETRGSLRLRERSELTYFAGFLEVVPRSRIAQCSHPFVEEAAKKSETVWLYSITRTDSQHSIERYDDFCKRGV
jgi:hypothetical protein